MSRIVVIGGPSASYKTTTGRHLEERHDWHRLITVTTRAPRPGERDGADYHFLTREQFAAADADGRLGERTQYIGNGTAYGIYLADMEAVRARAGPVYVVLDAVGLGEMRAFYGAGRVTGVFLWARRSVLEARMIARGDGPDEIAKRLQPYTAEMATSEQFDYAIDTCYLESVEVAEQIARLA